MRSAALTRCPKRIRTTRRERNAEKPTAMIRAATAAATDRSPPTTQDDVSPGFVRNRVPTAIGVTSARIPSRRITSEPYVAGGISRIDRTYHERSEEVRPVSVVNASERA